MNDEARDNHAQQIERAEIGNLVRSRMESLNLSPNDYDEVSEKRNKLSYVIINPSCDLKLEEGDIMWVFSVSIHPPFHTIAASKYSNTIANAIT